MKVIDSKRGHSLIVSWLESKKTNVPVQDVIRKKFLQRQAEHKAAAHK